MQVCQFNVQLVGGVWLSVYRSSPPYSCLSVSVYFVLFLLISASLNGRAIRQMHLSLTKCNRKQPHYNLNRLILVAPFVFLLISLKFWVDCTK